MSKSFSRNLYDQYNNHGIQVATDFLAQQGYEVINTEEAYKSHDFIVRKDNKNYKVEVEVKTCWKTTEFPYSTVSVPYRKKDSQADYYIMTNPAGSALFFIPMTQVKSAPVIRKNTVYTTNEPFFSVETTDFSHFHKEENTWVKTNVL